MNHKPWCPVQTDDVPSGMWVPHRASILKVWTDQTMRDIALDRLRIRLSVSFDELKYAVSIIVYLVDVCFPGEFV